MTVIPILLNLDVEPDLRQPRPGQPVDWRGWDATQRMLTEWRARLGTATGRPVNFSWYLRMDPQIEALHGDIAYLAYRDRSYLEACARAGDVLGVHAHAHRWDAAAGRWIIDHGDAAWVERVVELGCASFKRAFGRPLRCFRFGDRFTSVAVMRRLEQLGVQYDLSVEPGMPEGPGMLPSELSTGLLPHAFGAPRVPYRVSRRDFRMVSRWPLRRLWVVPVSTAPPPPGVWPGCEYVTMNFAHPPQPTSAMFDWLLAERAAPFAVLVVRAGDLAAPEIAANFQANMAALCGHARVGDFAFMSPPAFVRWYRRFG